MPTTASHRELMEADRRQRRERIYNAPSSIASRAEKQHQPDARDEQAARHRSQITSMQNKHYRESVDLSHRHTTERSRHLSVSRLPADIDARQAKERKSLEARHVSERDAINREHLAERTALSGKR